MKPSFSNSNTVGLHVTSACNRRCGHCYLDQSRQRDLDLRKAAATLGKLRFDNLLLYGGEPLVRPRLVRDILCRWPDKGILIASNGTIPDQELLDRADGLLLTVETFFYQRQPPWRRFGQKAFGRLMDVLDRWADKILVLHNVYPWGNDPAFGRLARLRGLRTAVYPVIVPGTNWAMDEADFRSLPVFSQPLVRPKLRVLEDGTLTRDMRGLYNGTGPLPLSPVCRACPRLSACPFCSMFPHFVRDVIRAMHPVEPWFCDCVRSYAHV